MVGGRNCLAYTKLKTPFPKVVYQDSHVFDDLASTSNKSPGLDGLSAEHFKFAHSRLLALMSMLVSSIVVHGHVPHYIVADLNVCVPERSAVRSLHLVGLLNV